MSSTETTPPMNPQKLRIAMSLADLKWVAIVIAAGAVAWGITTRNVADNTKRIDTLEGEARNTREVLIRIDERTAEIKRRLDYSK